MKQRIDYIDGLRAIAVLGVVAFHAAKWDLTLPRGIAAHALFEGAHGVDLFFVLSGFCLSYPTLLRLREQDTTGFDLIRYWAHRLLRIMPPYLCALIVLAVMGAVFVAIGSQTPAPAWVSPSPPLMVLRQMFFMDGAGPWTNGSFWSLAVEFRWYFLFPLLLWLWVKAPRAFFLVACASLAAYHYTLLKSWDFATLPAFMLGIVAADLHVRGDRSWRWALPGLGIAVAATVMTEPNTFLSFAYQPSTGWQLASFFFIATVVSVPALRAMLSVRPIVLVGLASYSIYLLHEPLIALIESRGAAGPIVAAACGVGIGFVMWMVFERSTTQGPLRVRWLPAIEGWVARAFRWFALPQEIDLAVEQVDHKGPPPHQPVDVPQVSELAGSRP